MQFLQQLLTLLVDFTVVALVGLVVLFAIAKARSQKSFPTMVKVKQKPQTVKPQEPAKVATNSPTAEAPTATPQPTTSVAKTPTIAFQVSSPVTKPSQTSLTERLVAMRNSAQTTDLLQSFAYKNHPDSQIRKLVALTLGKIATTKQLGLQIQPTISVLGELSRDADASVRQSAAIALGDIGSQKAIPFLTRALRDTDSDVVKSASAALSQFKNRSAASQLQTSLPKNVFKRSLNGDR